MNKFQELKKAIRNTPPERLAKIELQSLIMQMIGVTIVCGIFLYNGLWWIILAFVFSLGVSYAQAVTAYQKYCAIIDITGGSTYNYSNDKSPSRRRAYVIKKVFGFWGSVSALIISLSFCILIIPYDTWYYKILFTFSILIVYIIVYFFILYPIAKLFFREEK